MKSPFAALLVFAVLVLLSATAEAQGVYVTRGENGPVFSDKPRAGAREVNLTPLTVVPSIREPLSPEAKGAKPESRSREQAVIDYRSFSIVSPEHNGSVAANSSVFEVRLAVDPPLQLGEGHAFSVRINGRNVGTRFTATEFMIPPEFWEDGYLPANQSMQLDASIVDESGQVVKKAAPVLFHSRYMTVRHLPPPMLRPADPPPKSPERKERHPGAAVTTKMPEK